MSLTFAGALPAWIVGLIGFYLAATS